MEHEHKPGDQGGCCGSNEPKEENKEPKLPDVKEPAVEETKEELGNEEEKKEEEKE